MSSHEQRRPNIVWISLEDTSPRFGCFGDESAQTPNIDRLAQEGLLFRNAFATAGVCAPSRSAVITGMYATAIGTHHMRTEHVNAATPELPTPYSPVVPACVKLIPETFRAHGYYCTNNWKTDYQFPAPLTAWDENGAEAHWRHRDADQPFFAVFNYDFTHESGMWPAELRQRIGIGRDNPRVTDPERVSVPPYLPDTVKVREALAKHYDNIADSDAYVGRMISQLEEDGLSDNTIVMLWSDHGEGLPRAKRWTYDAGIRVPLIVRWPGRIQPGQATERLVSLIDLGPTVLSMAGLPLPRHLQGRAFLGERTEEPRKYVFAARDRFDEAYDKVRAVRDSRFKYIRNDHPEQPYLQWIPFSHAHPAYQELRRLQRDGQLSEQQRPFMENRRPPEEMYDCENDPYELNNLASDPKHRAELLRLRRELDRWCAQYDVWGDIPEAQMVETMWPGRVQPQASAPLFIPLNQELPGYTPKSEGTFGSATMVMLHSSTQGASIAYTFAPSPEAQWKLYTGPIALADGTTRIRAVAVRIGYKDSETAEAVFTIDSVKS